MDPGSQLLGASVRVMPLVKLAGPTDPRFLAARGNLPQAFTRLALISAAVNLDQALDRGKQKTSGNGRGKPRSQDR